MEVMCDKVEHYYIEDILTAPNQKYDLIYQNNGIGWVSYDWAKTVECEGTLDECRQYLATIPEGYVVQIQTEDVVILRHWEVNYPTTYTGYWIR